MRTPPGGLPSPLFPVPDAVFQKGLTELEPILRRVFPLKAKHRAQLPGGVRRLSAFLTVERENLPPDYMTRPEYLAAYLNYFLPWNIYRQGRLLQGLGLDLPENARILDLGAGPLTFLQALWMACPQLRARKLTYEGVDRAESVLKAGRHLFEEMTTGANSSWDIVTSRQLSDRNRPRADLLVAANFINELQDPG
nr:rRNA methyltransferase [Candidatus Krumholzibacteria bacterium]